MRIFPFENSCPLRSYLRAGRFLHIMTLSELALLSTVYPYLSISLGDLTATGIMFRLILVSFLAALPIFSQLDARSRYQNYKQLKDQLFIYGFDRRIFKPMLRSSCQRDAAQAAAEALGYGDECRKYFRSRGYRWYHLIPDFIFRAPYLLLTTAFWRRTFFMPTYHPKVDFKIMAGNGHFSLKESDI